MPEPSRTRDPNREAVMSFGDHLEELRRRAILALLVPLPVMLVAFFFARELVDILAEPLRAALRAAGQPDVLQSLGVTETMAVHIKLAFVVGIVVSAPWILYQLWKFVEPGLYEHERRFARFLVPGSALLVVIGLLTFYFILLPLMLQVLVEYSIEPRSTTVPAIVEKAPDGALVFPIVAEVPTEAVVGQAWVKMPEHVLNVVVRSADGTIQVLSTPLSIDSSLLQQNRLNEYVDFVLLLMFGIAVVFQLPLVMLLLGWVGILRVEMLREKRRLAIFILTIVAAAVTPTSDLTSMLLMLVPLYLLYELGILLLVAAPPGAIAEGSVVTGFLSRLRSGKRRPAPPNPYNPTSAPRPRADEAESDDGPSDPSSRGSAPS
ncbi:MAG: twin-arginine translocase subunit TatC [Phycisphaerae bacterium]|nr:twin-arginine translocase subunit TatC [Phycisphaerae bacterium]